MNDLQGLGHAAGIIVTGLAFALCRGLIPVRPGAADEPPLTDEERRRYARWESASIVPLFVFAPLLGFAWYLALRDATRLFPHDRPGTLFLVEPIGVYWMLPALFLGIVSSAVPMTLLYRALLGDRFGRFVRSCNERVGFDSWRLLRWLTALIALGSVAWFVVGVTTFACFDGAGVEIARPLEFRGTYYNYARVRTIEHRATFRAPNGNTISRPHYVVSFDDGSSWSTRGGLRDPVPDLDERIVRLVARKSGRAIVERL
ncbi:MAG TPA: hypothetical protein VG406_04700 [Isosphaeraceae bacterium]|jgi:hypothetical protein|nr:hypothetical protein [Isosphaeraceae bacterium]